MCRIDNANLGHSGGRGDLSRAFGLQSDQLVRKPDDLAGVPSMKNRAWLSSLAAIGITLITVACGSNPKAQVSVPAVKPNAAPQTPAVPPPPPPVDPITTLIATSQKGIFSKTRLLPRGESACVLLKHR